MSTSVPSPGSGAPAASSAPRSSAASAALTPADPGQVGLLAQPDSKLMHAGRIDRPALLPDGHVNVAPSAIDAGFDRVGLHGANGCLIHQLGTPGLSRHP